jgi:hypothetical protein
LIAHGHHSAEKHVSIVSFHRVLIAFAILFCAGYGLYELIGFTRDGGTVSLVMGGVFLILATGLSYYLWRLNHFLGYEE